MPTYNKDILRLVYLIKQDFEKNGLHSANLLLKNALRKYEGNEDFSWINNYSIVDGNGDICFAKDLSTPYKPSELYIEEIDLYLPKLKTHGWSSKEKFIKIHREKN